MEYRGYNYTIVRCDYSGRYKAKLVGGVLVPIIDSIGHIDRPYGEVLKDFDTYFMPHSEVWSRCPDLNLTTYHTTRYFAIKQFKNTIDFRVDVINVPVYPN